MKKNIGITFFVIGFIALLGGAWYYSNFRMYAPKTFVTDTPTGSKTTDTINSTETPGAPTYSLAQVSTHKDASSCYTILSGSVYDLTLWMNLHPGGMNPILSLCGKDGTDMFMNKHHGGEKFMTILARYKIGKLQ